MFSPSCVKTSLNGGYSYIQFGYIWNTAVPGSMARIFFYFSFMRKKEHLKLEVSICSVGECICAVTEWIIKKIFTTAGGQRPKAAGCWNVITAAVYVRLASPLPQIAVLSRPARGLLQQIVISFKPYYYFIRSMAENTTALKFNSFYRVFVFFVFSHRCASRVKLWHPEENNHLPLQRLQNNKRSEVRLDHASARLQEWRCCRGAKCFWGGFFFFKPAARSLICVGGAE